MAGAVKMTARLDVNSDVLRRARELLRGAPERVSAHRAHVGINEQDGGETKNDYYGKPTGLTVAEVARIHEFNGRSWLRTWFDQNLEKLKREMTDAMRLEYQGDNDAVGRQAMLWAVELKHWIQSQEGNLAALSPSTVKAKQEAGLRFPDVPLLATGQLVESIKAMLDGAAA
jgi:hypothetical protein